jgi:DNA-binding transcriptional ArsR family regulator
MVHKGRGSRGKPAVSPVLLPMSRFGVMKHLKVLEEAHLVTTQKRGRQKLHFLNPVPIRLVHDRWVSKYAEPWAATLTGLKRELEDDNGKT